MKETFTGRIRTAAKALSPNTFTARDLSAQAAVKTRKEDTRVQNVVCEFKRTGEMISISRGVYLYVGRPKKKKEVRVVMWRALRAMRNVTVEDMREMSGASDVYAREWLRALKRQEVVAEKNGRYRLIKDLGPNGMPENEEKAKALRDLRLKKKERMLAALDRAEAAIQDARDAMGGDDV